MIKDRDAVPKRMKNGATLDTLKEEVNVTRRYNSSSKARSAKCLLDLTVSMSLLT